MSAANSLALRGGQTIDVTPREASYQPAPMGFAEMKELAAEVARSGLFPGIDTAAKAMSLMVLCEAQGLHPGNAMMRYHIIFGRPSMKAEAILAEFRRQGGLYRIVEQGDAACEIEFWHPRFHPDRVVVRKTFADMEEKKVAMEYDKAKNVWNVKDMWKRFPGNMLFARTVSHGVGMVAPGVKAGIPTPEEVHDIVADERAALAGPGGGPALPPPSSPGVPDRKVIGQLRDGVDDRAFFRVCEDAVDEANRLWRGYQGRAGIPEPEQQDLTRRREVEREVYRQAVAAGLDDHDGSPLKPSEYTRRLADLYGRERAALREFLDSHLAGLASDAQEALDARLEADRAQAAAEAGEPPPPDDDLPEGRLPGED